MVPSVYIPYVPGHSPARTIPLARFLPPIPEGVVPNWLHANLPLEKARADNLWILDPFCTSPMLAVEAAKEGYRVLVAANNPISRFLLEMTANPPTEYELRYALAELSAARKGNERLEPYIRSLYTTQCDQCGADTMADAFFWEKGVEGQEPALFARSYHCQECGKSGEFPARGADISRAAQFGESGLHHARALERVTSAHDPDRVHVVEALGAYLPRATYALFTLLNKRDGINLPIARLRHLDALLLSACDQANTLWQYPTVRARPRQLGIPSRFRENNIWLALEQAVHQWLPEQQSTSAPSVNLVLWPTQPSKEGGISLYEGRLRDLVENLKEINIGAVVTAFPRPNHAFWTLSALWSGWLWGREAAAPFKSVLRRRRYDWGWHTVALRAILENLAVCISPHIPLFGLIGEAEPGFISAVLIAAHLAGYTQAGIAMRAESGQAQITLHRSSKSREIPEIYPSGAAPDVIVMNPQEEIEMFTRHAAIEYLKERAEPSHYLPLHLAAMSKLTREVRLEVPANITPPDSTNQPQLAALSPIELLSRFHSILDSVLSFRSGFLRFGGSEKTLEAGQWWLREPDEVKNEKDLPLADRVEMILVNILSQHSSKSLIEMDRDLCQIFPGLLTPSPELIQVSLESYGEQFPPESGSWRLRAEDDPSTRHEELTNIHEHLSQLAQRLDYHVEGQMPCLWLDSHSEIQYAWYVQASALIGKIILSGEYSPHKSLVVLPGGRANLVMYKLNHDPRLNQAVEAGWRFIKFRQIRWLAHSTVLNRVTFDEQLTMDSLTYSAPQMRLF